MNDSLVERDGQQLPLIPSDQMPASFFEESENCPRNPEFTAARFFQKHPEKYNAVIALTAEGLGVLRIGALLRCSGNTVMAVQDRERGQVEILKTRIASLARRGAQLCVEGILEALVDPEKRAKIPARDLAVIHGILVEKSELLSGGVTARIETIDRAEPSVADYERMMRELATGLELGERGQKGAIEADVIEVSGPAALGSTPAAGAGDQGPERAEG